MWDIFLASARLEWQRLRHDRWDFAMTFVVPMLAIGLIWWVFSAGLAQRLPIGVLDSDHSALSRQAVRMLQASQGLDVQQHYQNMAQVEAAMRSGHVAAVLVVPAGLERQVKTGRAARVTLIHNAQWSMPSGLIQRDVRSAIGTLSAGVEITIRTKRGQSPQQARTSFSPISTHMVGLFNVSSNYQEFLASNLMPALLHILAMTAGAWAIGRRLRDRTIGDWLHSVIPTASADAHALRYRDVLAAMLGKASWATLGMMAAASVAFTLMTGRIFAPFSHWVATWTGIYLLTALSVALGMFAAAATMSLRMALSVTHGTLLIGRLKKGISAARNIARALHASRNTLPDIAHIQVSSLLALWRLACCLTHVESTFTARLQHVYRAPQRCGLRLARSSAQAASRVNVSAASAMPVSGGTA